MNNVRSVLYGGGVFSKVMLAFQNIERKSPINLEEIQKVYIQNLDERIDQRINPFDYLYDQKYENIDIDIDYSTFPAYKSQIPEPMLGRFKVIKSKLKLNEKLAGRIELYENRLKITSDTLGVHVRLTDMNAHHSHDYGYKTFDDYVIAINKFIESNYYDKIFIACDNEESLMKLKTLFGDKIVYCENIMRPESETADTTFQFQNFSDEKFWQDSFIDMYLLSKCGTIICRVSNVVNASIVYANNLKQTILI